MFWNEVVNRLIKENKALVVQHKDKFYIADDFTVDEYVLHENIYSNVRVGDFTFMNKFSSSDVFHFRLNNSDVMKIMDSTYTEYGKLLTAAQNNYKRKNTPRLIVDIDANFSADDKNQKAVREYLGKQFKAFFEADGAGAINPLYKGMSLNKNYNQNNGNVIYNTRDVRAIIDDVFDFAAMSCHIPVKLIKGDMVNADNLVDLFVMGCIKPLAEILKDEINAKMYTKAQYLSRSYIKIDTSQVRLTDIVKFANAADRLFAAGINTINDNLEMLDRERIDEEWADTRFVTKNYETVEIRAKGGSDNNENTKNREKV